MLQPGDRIPEFEARDASGELIHSSTLTGRQNLVIFFYPKNFTGGCTAEVCSFRDNIKDFSAYNARVIGISGDSADSHKQFTGAYNLPFTLLADENRNIRTLFGIEKVMGVLENRVTFIIDKKGIIRERYVSQIFPTKHITRALTALAEIETTA